MALCRCGCGTPVKGKRVFVDKEHQLAWMSNGGASELNALQPLDAKVRGGLTAGQQAADTGRLTEASHKGAERAREIAERLRAARGRGEA
jgi:hypothetical protein